MSEIDALKSFTTVVCDTGSNVQAIAKLKPQDATTNPSLIYKAAVLPEYVKLVEDAVAYGKGDIDTTMDKLAVNFGTEIIKIVPGYVSTEVDARLSFDTNGTVKKARNIIELYKEAGIDKSRILVKIAGTWEGIQACKILEKEGITCNITLVFNLAQAIAVADVHGTLISPFVGRIMDWYKKSEGVDGYEPADNPGVKYVTTIYNYYKKHGYKTIVTGASFRNKGEILELAGCDRLTIYPALLDQLTGGTGLVEQKLDAAKAEAMDIPKIEMNKEVFDRMMGEDPMATEKLAEGIEKLVKDIVRLEDIVKAKAADLKNWTLFHF